MTLESGSLLNSLTSKLSSDQCQNDYATMKANAELTPEADILIDTYFTFKVKSLLESAKDVCLDGDESELQRLLSHIWIEYRMEWIRYNTQMQYQTVVRGMAEPELCARGAALSYLIGVIESFLSNEEIYWCTKLAVEPIEYLRSRSAMTSRMIELASLGGQAGIAAVSNIVELRNLLSSKIKNPLIDTVLDKTMITMEEIFTKASALSVADLRHSLEMVMTTFLASSPVPVILNRMSDNESILVPAVTIAGVNQLFSEWLKLLIETSVENSIEERRLSEKSDHVTIEWTLEEATGGRLLLELKDDGLGKNHISEFKNLPKDWQIEQEQIAGKGSRIKINFMGTQLAAMILFSCSGPHYDFFFAILADQVEEIFSDDQLTYGLDGQIKYARTKKDDQIYPLIDMAQVLFGKTKSSEKSVFIKVASPKCKSLIIKATTVDVIIKDSIKIGPKTLAFTDGYILYKGAVVSVIDISKLKEAVGGS